MRDKQLSANLRHSYLSRRTTQNISASRSSPTIDINLLGLPLSAVTVSKHYLPWCLRSIVACGRTPTTVTSSASSMICCHVIVTQQTPIIKQFAPAFRNLPLQAKKRIYWTANSSLHVIGYQNSEPDSGSVSDISANKSLLQELTQLKN